MSPDSLSFLFGSIIMLVTVVIPLGACLNRRFDCSQCLVFIVRLILIRCYDFEE